MFKMSIVSFNDSREENLSFRGLNLVGTAESVLTTPFNSKADALQDTQKTSDTKTEIKDLIDGAIATMSAALQQGVQDKVRIIEAESAAIQMDLLLAKEQNNTLTSEKANLQTKLTDLEDKWTHFRGEVSTLMSQHCKDVATSNQEVQHAQLQSSLLELQKEQLASELAEAMKEVKSLRTEKEALAELLAATRQEMAEVSKTIAAQVSRESAIAKELSMAQLALNLANYELEKLRDNSVAATDEVIAAKLKKTLADEQTVVSLLPATPVAPVLPEVSIPSVQVTEEDLMAKQIQQPAVQSAIAKNIPKVTNGKSGPFAAFLSSVLSGKKSKEAANKASSAAIQNSLNYCRSNSRLASRPGFFPSDTSVSAVAPVAETENLKKPTITSI